MSKLSELDKRISDCKKLADRFTGDNLDSLLLAATYIGEAIAINRQWLNRNNMIQVIICKGCGKSFAGCREPECYEDEEWMKDIIKYSKEGGIIKMVENVYFELERCTCGTQTEEQSELF